MFKRVLIAFLWIFFISGTCFSGFLVHLMQQNYYTGCLLRIEKAISRHYREKIPYCAAVKETVKERTTCSNLGILQYMLKNNPLKTFYLFYLLNDLSNELNNFYSKLIVECDSENCTDDIQCKSLFAPTASLGALYGVIANIYKIVEAVNLRETYMYIGDYNDALSLLSRIKTKTNETDMLQQFNRIYNKTKNIFIFLGFKGDTLEEKTYTMFIEYVTFFAKFQFIKETESSNYK